MPFTRDVCQDVGSEAIAILQRHFGNRMKVERGNGSFTSHNFDLKIKFSLPQADGTIETAEMRDFKRYQFQHQLPADSLGKMFNFRGVPYCIKGYARKSWKRPILATELGSGRTFKFDVQTVRNHLPTTSIPAQPAIKVEGQG